MRLALCARRDTIANTMKHLLLLPLVLAFCTPAATTFGYYDATASTRLSMSQAESSFSFSAEAFYAASTDDVVDGSDLHLDFMGLTFKEGTTVREGVLSVDVYLAERFGYGSDDCSCVVDDVEYKYDIDSCIVQLFVGVDSRLAVSDVLTIFFGGSIGMSYENNTYECSVGGVESSVDDDNVGLVVGAGAGVAISPLGSPVSFYARVDGSAFCSRPLGMEDQVFVIVSVGCRFLFD